MIGVPMANPKDAAIAGLHRQMGAFFGAGKKAQEIARGVSGEVGGPIKSTRSIKLRAARDKDAPRLKDLAATGLSAIEQAEVYQNLSESSPALVSSTPWRKSALSYF